MIEMDSVDQLPASLRPSEFKVGDRVRVRLSGECQVRGIEGSEAARRQQIGHFAAEDGVVGRVRRIYDDSDPLAQQGHPYTVHFSIGKRELSIGVFACCGAYAAIELEPLEAES